MSQVAKKTNSKELAILKVSISNDKVTAQFSDDRIVSIPISWFPRLSGATPRQRRNFQISPSGYGIHWPDVDEDISIKSFIS